MNKNLSLILATIVGLFLTIGLTGCSSTKSALFEYKESKSVNRYLSHDSQIQMYRLLKGNVPAKNYVGIVKYKIQDGDIWPNIYIGLVASSFYKDEKFSTYWTLTDKSVTVATGNQKTHRIEHKGQESSRKPHYQRNNVRKQNSQVNTLSGIGFLLKSLGDGLNSGTNNRSYNAYTTPSSSQKRYKNSFGNLYQYELNNPVDRIKYKSDPGAQLRDRVTPNSYRDIEKNTLQEGGGIYPTANPISWTPVN